MRWAMFKFTIRDLLWLYAVIALAVWGFLERDGRVKETHHIRGIFRENESLKAELGEANRALQINIRQAQAEYRRVQAEFRAKVEKEATAP